MLPEEGFRGLIGPSWVFQLGSSRQGLGGEWWRNGGCPVPLSGEQGAQRQNGGGAGCHSVGDRGNEPHLILIHFFGWLGTWDQGAPLSGEHLQQFKL